MLQIKLQLLELKEFEEIKKHSQDEAIRLTLHLAEHPPPPMPDYEIEDSFKSKSALGDLIDDVFEGVDDKYGYSSAGSSSSGGGGGTTNYATLTDAEAVKMCTEWKQKYSVVTGVSWGNLPYDLQQKWLHYSCDYHLADSSTSFSSSSAKEAKTQDDLFVVDKGSAGAPSAESYIDD